MSLGRNAGFQAVHDATCRDMRIYHATFEEEKYAYEISAAYYGWTFATEPNCR
jgi:hypothetical protein